MAETKKFKAEKEKEQGKAMQAVANTERAQTVNTEQEQVAAVKVDPQQPENNQQEINPKAEEKGGLEANQIDV